MSNVLLASIILLAAAGTSAWLRSLAVKARRTQACGCSESPFSPLFLAAFRIYQFTCARPRPIRKAALRLNLTTDAHCSVPLHEGSSAILGNVKYREAATFAVEAEIDQYGMETERSGIGDLNGLSENGRSRCKHLPLSSRMVRWSWLRHQLPASGLPPKFPIKQVQVQRNS